MLAACAARLRERSDLIWVDMGGGTGVSKHNAGVRGVAYLSVQHTHNEPLLERIWGRCLFKHTSLMIMMLYRLHRGKSC